jgi:hypothetical protein
MMTEQDYYNKFLEENSQWRHLFRAEPRFETTFPAHLRSVGIDSWESIYKQCVYVPLAREHLYIYEVKNRDDLARLNEELRASPEVTASWMRGDFVATKSGIRYRNHDLLMWDGSCLIYLNGNIDDYGSVSTCFKAIEEFPPNYWQDLIDHNEIINIDFAKLGWKESIYKAVVSGEPSVEVSYNNITYRCDIVMGGNCSEFYTHSNVRDGPSFLSNVVVMDKTQFYSFKYRVNNRNAPIYQCYKEGDHALLLELLEVCDGDFKGFDYPDFMKYILKVMQVLEKKSKQRAHCNDPRKKDEKVKIDDTLKKLTLMTQNTLKITF